MGIHVCVAMDRKLEGVGIVHAVQPDPLYSSFAYLQGTNLVASMHPRSGVLMWRKIFPEHDVLMDMKTSSAGLLALTKTALYALDKMSGVPHWSSRRVGGTSLIVEDGLKKAIVFDEETLKIFIVDLTSGKLVRTTELKEELGECVHPILTKSSNGEPKIRCVSHRVVNSYSIAMNGKVSLESTMRGVDQLDDIDWSQWKNGLLLWKRLGRVGIVLEFEVRIISVSDILGSCENYGVQGTYDRWIVTCHQHENHDVIFGALMTTGPTGDGVSVVKRLSAKRKILVAGFYEKNTVFTSLRSGEELYHEIVDENGNVIEEFPVAWNPSKQGHFLRSVHLLPIHPSSVNEFGVLVVGEDDSLAFHEKSGLSWVREEAITTAMDVAWVDLPVASSPQTFETPVTISLDGNGEGEGVAELVDIGDEDELDDFSYIKMLRAQWKSLMSSLSMKYLTQTIMSLAHPRPAHVGLNGDGDDLVGDVFGFRKFVLLLGQNGDLVALSTHRKGKVMWSLFLPSFVERAHSLKFSYGRIHSIHGSHVVAVVLATDSDVLIVSVNALTGTIVSVSEWRGKRVVHSFASHAGVELITSCGRVRTIRLSHHAAAHSEDHVTTQSMNQFVLFEKENGCFVGGQITQDKHWIERWRNCYENAHETILSVHHGRGVEDKVGAAAYLTHDDTILHKYINPNLFAVATSTVLKKSIANRGTKEIPVVSVYLVDGITGRVLEKAYHLHAEGPVRLAMSEEMVVYSLWDKKAGRNQLSVMQLFFPAGADPTTTGEYFDPEASIVPDVRRRSYEFKYPVRSITPTVTRFGITRKDFLVVLHDGSVLLVPRTFLNALRPLTTDNQKMVVRDVFPYDMHLPARDVDIISFNMSMDGIQWCSASPTTLESTSVVFCGGLDIFSTRIAPSKPFDILDKSYRKGLLVVLIMALCAVFVAMRWLVKWKETRQSWE
jgi:hypothetical protein